MTDTIKYQSTLESSRYDGDLETPLANGKSTFGKLAFTEDIFDKDQNRALADIIKDKVDINKLTPEMRELINSATGVPENLVKDMEQWNNRIAALESDKLTSKVIIYASDVVEYVPNNSSSYITIQLQNANGIISKDANYTHKHLYYRINNSDETDVLSDNATINYTHNAPEAINITARGTANYKGIPVTFPVVSKTIYAVLPSYIGYIEDYNNWNNTGIKLVKHSLNGQYNVTNPYDLAYLVIAIPKNGMVSNISSIIQKGTLDAVQQYNVIDKGNYTLYICRTRHIKGSYTFAVS